MTVLVESSESGRSYREAPEIDGVVRLRGLPAELVHERGAFVRARCIGSEGPDLIAEVVAE